MSESTEFPRAWRFHSDAGDADGPVFEGRFTGVIEMGQSSYGESPVARFVQEGTGEEISVWLFNQALRDRLIKSAPEKGELTRIEYKGKKKSKTSKFSYQVFTVTMPERPQVELSWSALGSPDVDEEEEAY